MPDKRYKAIVDGKEEFFDVGENRYDEFISMYPDATLVEDFQTGVTETGASATPEINQASENGVLKSEDTSLGQDWFKNVHKSLGRTGDVKDVNQKPISEEDKRKTIEYANFLNTEANIDDKTDDIYKKHLNIIPKTEIGTFDFKNAEKVKEYRQTVISDFIQTNPIIKDNIVPEIEKNLEVELKDYAESLKIQMGLDNQENITDENLDKFNKNIQQWYNNNLNNKLSNDDRFQSLVTAFDDSVTKKLQVELNATTQAEDMPFLYKAAEIAKISPNKIDEKIVRIITESWNGLRGIKNRAEKTGIYGGLSQVGDIVNDFERTEQQAVKNNWSDNTEGYWVTDTQQPNIYRFMPKYQKDIGNASDKLTWRPSKSIEGTWGEFKKSKENYLNSQQDKIKERLLDVQEKEMILQAYDNDSFNKILKGEDVLNNLIGLSAEQLAQMALSLVTLGASSGLQIGGDIYTQGVDIEARKRFKVPENKEVTVEQKIEVFRDKDFMSNLVQKATGGGFVAGQLDRFGAGKVLKPFTLKGTQAILRGGYKNFLKKAANNTAQNTYNSSIETITETLQEVIQAAASGDEIKSEQLFEAGGTAFLTSSLIGVSGNVKTQSLAEINAANRIIAGKLNPNSSEALFNAKIKNLDNLISKETNLEAKLDLEKKREATLDIKNANSKLPKKFTKEGRQEALDLIVEKTAIEKDINGKDENLVVNEKERIKEINEKLNVLASKEATLTQAEAVKDIIGEEGITIFSSKKEMEDADYSEADLNSDGLMLKDGKIIINLEVASKMGNVSVASHELLHKVLRSEFKNNQDMPRVVNEFRQILDKKGVLKELDDRANVLDSEGNRVYDININEDGTVTGKDIDEYLNFFSDAIGNNKILFNKLAEPEWLRIGKSILRFFAKKIGRESVEFKSGKQVFDFIRDYQKSIKKGKLTTQAKQKLKASIGLDIEDDKKSVTLLNTINNLAPETVKTREDFLNPRVFNKVYESTIGDGAISNYVKSKSTSTEMYENTMDSIRDRLMNYNPATDRKTKTGEPITFGEFIFANTNFAKLDAKKKLALEAEERKRTTSSDTKEAKQIADTSTTTQQVEAPKYKNLVESKVLDTDARAKVKAKIISTTRVLKSRIDAAVSKNKTVTPLISEIKKEMGKQADIEFKKMLGVKKDGELRRNYLSLKKPILENMTTTWLMQAMPFAIQKQVDGKFTSDWQGKKIDRETVETDKAGRTSGAEIVRRLPNAVNKVSTEEFLSYMFKDGEVIRGRKESLAKAMAEEYALDVYSIELRNPDSEIRKAFEGNQERLGVELAENFVQEFSRQSERGNVKRSVTLFRQMLDLEIQGDIDGATEIFETLNEAGKQLWLEATSDLRTDNLRYKQALKKLDLPKNVSNLLELYFENNSARDNKQAMKEYYEFSLAMIEALPNSLVKALGHDFFGAHYRYMNPAVANSYGAKIKSIIDALPIVDSDITLIQAGFGLVEKITKDVLHKEFKTTQEKVDYFLENYGAQIQALNIANKKAIETIVSTAFDLAIKKPQYAVGFLRMLESTTNIGKSLRALTGISDIQMTAASQAVYVNKKTGQGYTNKAKKAKAKEIESGEVVINTKHPNYKEAQQFIKDGSKQTIDQLLRIKGEHATPSSNFNVAIGTELLTALSQALENPGGIGFVKNALIAKINQLSADFNQQLNTKVLSDIQDAKLGSTSDIGDLRLLAIPTESQDAFFDIQGYQTVSRVNRLINAMFSSKNVSEFAKIQTQQKALNNARKASYSLNPKGISVYDFDDTLAFSKSQVIVNKDGKTYKITPAEFAKQGETLANEGATFDFSEFSKVVKGTPGPLAPRLKKAIDKFGNKNIFVLTARPADSASSIYTFLKGIGLEIPFENITGLANGAPAAKAAWMIGKVADGYNDFYFVDDHMGNVKAVKDVLDVFDVKGKVQQARVKRSVTLSKEFNEMIARQTGIASEKEFSKVVARRRGKKQGKYKFFLPPSAEDFRGLTQYVFAGKGKQGEADQAFFEQNLMDPYFQGVSAIDQARQTIKNDMKGLLSMFKPVKNKLGKLTPDGDYTFDAAVRVYLWTKAGYEIPGISKRDQNKLNKLVNKDPELSGFADGLLAISKKEKWSEPGEYWDSQTVISDLNNLTEKVNRKEYLAEFIENVDNIFSETNLNKIEALYGKSIRESLEDSIYAMKTGSNRPSGSNGITNRWLNWVNNSVGTIMFFNRRSALLQTISSVNFINWSDNNPAKAAAAFANQPQFWKDFATLFNSDKLKQRRGGLKSDVQEAEIANAAKNTKDKANAIISYLLKIGFTPTQLADSFAIASGGATFYRNRINTYKKQGLSQQEAETKAFSDFSKLSDESQQSGDPALVSSQQRSVAGRLILAFQNTPMQYTRLMKKSAQDLINGRGDAKTHISKILYYGAIQNFIFNALQNALFALIPGFDEEDDDDKKALAQEKKAVRILNGMVDSVLRGTGMYGAIVSTIKNTYMKYQEQEEKGFTANHAYTIIEAANISPPIGSKLRKIHSAIQTGRFDKDIIEKYPWTVSLDGKLNISPTYSIIGNLASAAINLPLDRAIMEAQGIAEALDVRNTNAQRIALGLGWRTWDVGAKNEEFDLIKTVNKSKRKEQSKKKSKQARETKKQEEKKRVENMTAEEYNAYINAKALKRREAAVKAAETRIKNR